MGRSRGETGETVENLAAVGAGGGGGSVLVLSYEDSPFQHLPLGDLRKNGTWLVGVGG